MNRTASPPPAGPRLEAAVHGLYLFGAGGIAAFGWAVCQVLQAPAGPWLPLWLAAGLLVYNLDRLRCDPTDCLSTPARVETLAGLRRWSRGVLLLAGMVLLLLPCWRRDWLTLTGVLSGLALVIFYPIPLRGWRLKDVPVLKSILPPGFVLGATFGLPVLHGAGRPAPGLLALSLLWGGALLLGNMILCDARDMAADRQAGVRSLPVLLGARATRWLLGSLALAAAGAGLLATLLAAPGGRAPWLLLAVVPPGWLAALTWAARRPRPELFYERWVEGLLYVPALCLLPL